MSEELRPCPFCRGKGEMGIEECSYCKYQDSCNHEPVNCYGGELIYSPCGDSATDWIDAELLKNLIGGENNA